MPKPRVYVETTIPSFYHDPRTSPAVLARRRWTRLWWARAAERYELVTSKYVVEELAAGSMDLARERLRLIQPLLLLGSTARMLEAARIYVDQKLMPAYPPYDAYHLALASCHDCDFILTWNCKHLANPNKAGRVEQINLSLGLYVPRARDSTGFPPEGTMSDAFDADDLDAILEWDDEVDAIIEEIWEVRRKIWERFDNDPVKMGQHYMALERQSGRRVIYGPRFPRARIPTPGKGLRRSRAARVRQ